MKLIAIPRILREKLGEEGADALLELINQANENVKGNVIELSAEKFEKRLTEESAKLDKRITDEIVKLDKKLTDEIAKLDKKLTDEIVKLDKRLTDEIAKLDKRLTDEIAKLRVEISQMDAKMSHIYANIIKWMFIFWIGQVGAIIGILFAFFR